MSMCKNMNMCISYTCLPTKTNKYSNIQIYSQQAIHDPIISMVCMNTQIEGAMDILSCVILMQVRTSTSTSKSKSKYNLKYDRACKWSIALYWCSVS